MTDRLLDEEEGHRVMRATLVTRTFLLLGIVLITGVLLLLIDVGADTNRVVSGVEAQQDMNTNTLRTGQETLDLIRDCTQPKGECFIRSAEATAEAVGNIGRVSVYAAACAADPARQAQTIETRAAAIEKCVTRLVARTTPPAR